LLAMNGKVIHQFNLDDSSEGDLFQTNVDCISRLTSNFKVGDDKILDRTICLMGRTRSGKTAIKHILREPGIIMPDKKPHSDTRFATIDHLFIDYEK